MNLARKTAVGVGWLVSVAVAFVFGWANDALGSDGEVALLLGLMTSLVVWPFFLPRVSFLVRAALACAILCALVTGLRNSPCGRDGQGSASEICLGQCSDSLARLRDYEHNCWRVKTGRAGRLALAITCASAEPLRDWRGPSCARPDPPR